MNDRQVDSEVVAPVVDISTFFGGDAERKASVARKVGAACEDTGFYTIAGHGVDRALIDRMAAVTRAYFALDEREKQRTACAGTGPGYRPLESRRLAATRDDVALPDLKEGFVVGPLLPHRALPSDYVTAPGATDWFMENLWPDRPPEFREIWTAYYRAMESLGSTLMRISALALGLPESYFDSKFDRHVAALSAKSYPPVLQEPLPGQLRAGAHTDYGGITILWKDDGSGSLQVIDKSGVWRDIVPQPDCFIVNIGDLLAQWTNDRWVSTLHRVIMPDDPKDRMESRLSLPFFYMPNYDTVVETIETCIDDRHPLRYSPVTAAEHFATKVRKNRVGDAAP